MDDIDKQVEMAAQASKRAHEKVDAQRGHLAAMSVGDPHRPEEEALLQSMIQTAVMADTNLSMTMDREDQAVSMKG